MVLGCHLGITWHQEEEEAHLSVMGSGILLILCTLVVAGRALKFGGAELHASRLVTVKSDLAWWLDRLTHLYYINYLLWLVVWNMAFNFPIILGNVIIPTD